MTAPVLEGFRISPQQRRLWSLDEVPAATAEVRVEGPLDRQRLAHAARWLAQRHEILRTAFRRDGGLAMPVQVVLDDLPPELALDDLQPLPEVERHRGLRDLALARQAPFTDRQGLANGVPLSIVVVRLAAEEHYLLLRLPGLMADAAAMSRLASELAWAYGADSDGAAMPPELADEPLQYADLAEVLNDLVEGEDAADGRHYWASRGLAEVPSPALPSAGLEPRIEDAGLGRGSSHRLQLDPAVGAAVTRLAEELGVDERAVCFAAWALLAHRLTGEGKLLAGLVAAGRNFEGLEEALGPFARLLPVVSEADSTRFAAAAAEPFREWALRVAANLAEAAEWQESFDREELSALGVMPPALATAFDYHRVPAAVESGSARFKLLITLAPLEPAAVRATVIAHPGAAGQGSLGLEIEVSCDPAAYGSLDPRLLAGRFASLLEHATAAPQTAVDRLDVVAVEERLRLDAWNDTTTDSAATTFVDLFTSHAAAHPEAPAIRRGDEIWTYDELDRHTAALAGRLRARGCGPESVVGVCMGTSVEAVMSLVAVLRCGAAFLPLDPAHPAERLSYLVADAGARVVLVRAADEGSLARLPAGVERLEIDVASPPAMPLPDLRPLPVSPHRLAYVLYTSGSTGQPKGVAVGEGNLLNYLAWVGSRLLAGACDTVAATSGLSFDAFLKQLLSPLAAGREVWLPAAGGVSAPVELMAELAARPGSALNTVPSLWHVLLDHLEQETEPTAPGGRSLAGLLLGGEATSPELLERTFRALPDVEVWNLYGPTEVTANASAGRLLPGAPVHLGSPLDNVRVHLLDRHGMTVPLGVCGEICVAGNGLARGYLGRPGRTAAAFVPDSHASAPGGRLYRTGDLGRLDASGSLYYQGRADDQVKVRGIRVEVGEVEALVASHPGVGRCAAALVGEGSTARLAAVCTPAAGVGDLTGDELSAWTSRIAPEHLMPTLWAVAEELPTLPSGKVDRAAIAALVSPATSGRRRPPETATERALAGIWRELLQVPEVSAEDEFFSLGGHSLLAIQLLSRIRVELGARLPMARVLEAADLAALAAEVDADRDGDVPAIKPRPAAASQPLSLAEEKLWFLAQLDPASPAYNIPAALRLEGVLNPAALAAACAEVERRHPVLRSTYASVQGQPVRQLRPPRVAPLPVLDLAALAPATGESEVGRLATLEARRPFDLAHGPLWRRSYVLSPGGASTLLLTTHHIVSDGWSTSLVLGELAKLYAAFAAGRPSPLEEPRLHYADYAHWQRHFWRGAVLEEQVDYWRRRLEGLGDELLTPDRPRGEAPSSRGTTLYGALPGEVADALEGLGRESGATLFMVLLAAFKVVLARAGGTRDVAVGTDVMNRDRVEVQGMVGFFVNQVVLRTDLAGDAEFSGLVSRVRETALGAYGHQELPFHQLVSHLGRHRDLARNPLFQVMFSLQNTPRPDRRLGAVAFEPLRAETASSVFDLSLYVLTEREAGDLPLALRYNTDLFHPETMSLLLDHFVAVAQRVATRPRTRWSELVAELDEVEASRAEASAAAARARGGGLRGRRHRATPAVTQEPRRQR